MEIKYDMEAHKLVMEIEDYERANWKDGSKMLEDAIYEHGTEDVSGILTNYDEADLYELQRQFWGEMNIEELFSQLRKLSDTCYKDPIKGASMVRKAEELYKLLLEYLNHVLGELIEEELSKFNNKQNEE